MKKLLLFLLSFSIITPARPIPLTAQNIAIGGTGAAAVLGAAALIARGQIKSAERNAKRTPTKRNQARVKALKAAAKALGFSALGVFLLGGLGALGQRHRLHAKDAEGNTLLLKAAAEGNFEKVKSLIEQGADVRATNNADRSVQDLLLANSPDDDSRLTASIRSLDPDFFIARRQQKEASVEHYINTGKPDDARQLLIGSSLPIPNPQLITDAINHFTAATAQRDKAQWQALVLKLLNRIEQISNPDTATELAQAFATAVTTGEVAFIAAFPGSCCNALSDEQKTELLLAAPNPASAKVLIARLLNDNIKHFSGEHLYAYLLSIKPWFLNALNTITAPRDHSDSAATTKPAYPLWLFNYLTNDSAALPLMRSCLQNKHWDILSELLTKNKNFSAYAALSDTEKKSLDELVTQAVSSTQPLTQEQKNVLQILAPHYLRQWVKEHDITHLSQWLNAATQQALSIDLNEVLRPYNTTTQRAPELNATQITTLATLFKGINTTHTHHTIEPNRQEALIASIVATQNTELLTDYIALYAAKDRPVALHRAFVAALQQPVTPGTHDAHAITDWIIAQDAFDSIGSTEDPTQAPIALAAEQYNAHAFTALLNAISKNPGKKAALFKPVSNDWYPGVPAFIIALLNLSPTNDYQKAAVSTMQAAALGSKEWHTSLSTKELTDVLRLAISSGNDAFFAKGLLEQHPDLTLSKVLSTPCTNTERERAIQLYFDHCTDLKMWQKELASVQEQKASLASEEQPQHLIDAFVCFVVKYFKEHQDITADTLTKLALAQPLLNQPLLMLAIETHNSSAVQQLTQTLNPEDLNAQTQVFQDSLLRGFDEPRQLSYERYTPLAYAIQQYTYHLQSESKEACAAIILNLAQNPDTDINSIHQTGYGAQETALAQLVPSYPIGTGEATVSFATKFLARLGRKRARDAILFVPPSTPPSEPKRKSVLEIIKSLSADTYRSQEYLDYWKALLTLFEQYTTDRAAAAGAGADETN